MVQKKKLWKVGKEWKSEPRVDPLKTKVECCPLPDGRLGEIHYIPRLNLTIGIDPYDERSPISMILKNDGSLKFYRTSVGPVATIATESGEIGLSTVGLRVSDVIMKRTRKRTIPWTDGKEIASVMGTLAWRDTVFQSAVVFVPGGLITALDTCGLERGFIDLLRYIPSRLEDCTDEFIPAVMGTVDRTVECMGEAWDQYGDCNSRCGRRRKVWRRPICYAGCALSFVDDESWCVLNGIVEIILEAAHTVENCVLLRGVVDGPPTSGDILLFEADSPPGHAIDLVTCGYGYSHAGLVCGENVIHAIGEGVVQQSLSHPDIEGRDRAIVRLGLTHQQIEELCKCVSEKIGGDYDYIEAATFGTVDEQGREMCTMLIMHCLDQIGVDRSGLGLLGFVSPNDIARTYNVPHGHLV